MVRVIEWRCSNGSCNGAILANVVNVESGWIERKCRKCGKTAHVGTERGREPAIDVKCNGDSGYTHVIALASNNWRGAITIRCDRCKTESTIHAATMASEPQRSVAASEPLMKG